MSSTLLTGIRVVLDLEVFFQDRRKKCYYYIDLSRNKVVRDICNGIKSNFAISNDIFLEINGYYVPESEDIRVVNNEDVIKVIAASSRQDNLDQIQNGECDEYRNIVPDTADVQNKLHRKKLKRLDGQEGNENDITVVPKPMKRKKSRKGEVKEESKHCVDVGKPVKKRKNASELDDSFGILDDSLLKFETGTEIMGNSTDSKFDNTEVLHEASKCKAEIPWKYRDNDPNHDSKHKSGAEAGDNGMYSTVDFPRVQTHKLDPNMFATAIPCAKVDLSHNNPEANSIDAEKGKEFEIDNAEVCKELESSNYKRRRRRRQRKSAKDTAKRSDSKGFVPSFSMASVLLNTPQKTSKHIKFPDEDYENNCANSGEPNSSFDDNETKMKKSHQVQLHSQSEDTNVENKLCSKNENNIQLKSGVPRIDTFTKGSDICSNFVVQASSTPIIFECKRTNRSSCESPVKKENEANFDKYPKLSNAPKVNDIIAFKKLKMDSNYCPSMSDYISAKVIQVSEINGLATLRILNGHQEFKEPQGKFSMDEENDENNENDENDKSKVKVGDDVEMNVTDLLDVRLMFP